MGTEDYSIVWNAQYAAGAGILGRGACVVKQADGKYIIATAANRAALAKRSAGISRTTTTANDPNFNFQFVGVLAPDLSALPAGPQDDYVRVSATGYLERVTVPGAGDDIVGRCDADGTAYVCFGIFTAGISTSALPGAPDKALQYRVNGTTFGGETNWTRESLGRLNCTGSGFLTLGAAGDSFPTAGFIRVGTPTAPNFWSVISWRSNDLGEASIFQVTNSHTVTVSNASFDSLFTGNTIQIGHNTSAQIELITGTSGFVWVPRNMSLFGFDGASMGAGQGLAFLADATTNPTTNPTGGIYAYVDGADSHKLKYRKPDGSIVALDGVAATDPSVNGLRLTLTSGTPVTTSDVATATTIFLTPFISGTTALYIGSAWTLKTTAEISLALGTLTSGKNYDVFEYWTGSVVALEFSAAWTNDTTRSDAIATQDGVTVKSTDHSRRYVGTIRTISTTQTTDTAAQRFVYNGPEPARQVWRPMRNPREATSNWTYTTASFRQANANTANKFEYVTGFANALLEASVHGLMLGSAANIQATVGIGLDSTTVNSAQRFGARATTVTAGPSPTLAFYEGYPGLGYHAVNWLEFGATTTTFYGDNANATAQQAGLYGRLAA